MNWSYQRPMVSGYYWWQYSPLSRPRIVELMWIGGRWLIGDCRESLEPEDLKDPGDGGRWAGPIQMPNAYLPWQPSP